MATQSDVEAAIAALIQGALYPNWPATPSALGYPVKIYAGWPLPNQLDEDLKETGGKPHAAHVSIYPLPGERNVTRYPGARKPNTIPGPTYSLSAVGSTITVGGAAPGTYAPQNLAVLADHKAYVVQATAGQTAQQLAAALQALIVQDLPGTTVAGSNITLPDGAQLQALRVGVTGSTRREVRRTEKQFQITVWSSNPASRAAVADAFDPLLADTPFLALPDGSSARLLYHGSRDDDFAQKQRIYRRSFVYLVEFPTTITEPATQIVVEQVLIADLELLDDAGNVVFGLEFDVADNSQYQPGL